ncbi:hypothetical protein [uncultured Sulfitobacter sp.]|uniref:hypothetical protein n=1 Tax=uncultured Sulfitobacter sp. TaxID=191468 RepID=UPI0025935F1F|nr:hypothetical protein [uncultured Sulfitobacter sp.]
MTLPTATFVVGDIGVIKMALLNITRRMTLRKVERRTGMPRNAIKKYLNAGIVEPLDLSWFDAAPSIVLLQQRRLTMGLKRTNEFHHDAVRTALTSGLTGKQLADDLGIGTNGK